MTLESLYKHRGLYKPHALFLVVKTRTILKCQQEEIKIVKQLYKRIVHSYYSNISYTKQK